MTEHIPKSCTCSILVLALVAVGTVGCGGTTSDDGTSSGSESISKEEARERQQSKADHGVDYCEQYNFYDDGICDDWCPDPDPDCKSADNSCQSDADCASDEYCAFDGNACTAGADGGTCTQKPAACTQQYDPVCGCDGTTYSNSCMAESAGANVAHEGECDSNGDGYDPCANKTCGERCTKCPPNDDDCAETAVLKYCHADGSCEATTPQCSGNGGSGCTSDSDCGSGDYCAKTGQNACSSSATGTCENTPQFCTEEYAPVCGCDGQTYGNDCKAQSAGVNIAHSGECN